MSNGTPIWSLKKVYNENGVRTNHPENARTSKHAQYFVAVIVTWKNDSEYFEESLTCVGNLQVLVHIPTHLLSSRYLHLSTYTCKILQIHPFEYYMIIWSEYYTTHKDQTQKKVQVITPLLHEVPSGRSTELTLQGPMSHWQVSAVTLASKLKRF